MLKGKKVVLRPVRKSDVKYFLKWLNNPEVTQYLVMYLPLTEGEEERWLQELETVRKNDTIFFTIEDKKTKKPIGGCSFQKVNYKDQTAEMGIAIGEKRYWSKGFGTEIACLLIDYGFNTLNLNKIFSAAVSFNKRSINMQKKVGLKEAGRLRQHKFVNGKFYDLVMFDLLREEWKKKKNNLTTLF